MNRFAGTLININPSAIPQYGDRWAGQVIKENPGIVKRVASAIGIVPAAQQATGEPVAQRQA
jgi:hypothetical protein